MKTRKSPRVLVQLAVLSLLAAITYIFAAPLSNAPVPFDVLTNNTTAAVQSNTLTNYTQYNPMAPMVDPEPLIDGETPVKSVPVSLCAKMTTDKPDKWTAATAAQYLPSERWGEVSGMHTRLSSGTLGVGNIAEKIQRDGTITFFLNAGNTAWNLSSQITQEASRFCLADKMGYSIDNLVGKLGMAILNSGLVALLVVIGIAGIIWKASRGENPGRELVRVGATLGLLGMMIFGATKTTGDAGTAKFGPGSPGWWANMVNITVANVSQAPANAMNDIIAPSKGTGAADISNSVTSKDNTAFSNLASCDLYTQELSKLYAEQYATGYGLTYKPSSIVPRSLDNMWQSTGLRSYINAQFGSNNIYGDKVYCRLMDYKAGMPIEGDGGKRVGDIMVFPASQINVLNRVGIPITTDGKGTGINPKSLALAWGGTNSSDEDRAIVAWASCNFDSTSKTWKADETFSKLSKHKVKDDDCKKFFTQAATRVDAFDWGDNPDDIAAATAGVDGGDQVADFLYNLHGNKNAGAIGTSFLYMLSSAVIMVVFVALGGAVFIAKLGLIALTLFAIFVILAGLLPGSSDNVAANLAKQYFGMAIFAFGANVLISFVAILTAFIQNAGTDIGKSGSAMQIVWAGIAPVAAIFMMHYIITKLFKAPSPFKPTAGAAFGAAAAGGALGSGAGGAIDRMSRRAMSRGRSQMRRQNNRMMRSMMKRNRQDAIRAGAMGAMGGGLAAHALDRHNHDGENKLDRSVSEMNTNVGDTTGSLGGATAAPAGAAGAGGKKGIIGAMGGKFGNPILEQKRYATSEAAAAKKAAKYQSLGKPNGWDKSFAFMPGKLGSGKNAANFRNNIAAGKERIGARINRTGANISNRAHAAWSNKGKYARKAGIGGGAAMAAALALGPIGTPLILGGAAAYAGIKGVSAVKNAHRTRDQRASMRRQSELTAYRQNLSAQGITHKDVMNQQDRERADRRYRNAEAKALETMGVDRSDQQFIDWQKQHYPDRYRQEHPEAPDETSRAREERVNDDQNEQTVTAPDEQTQQDETQQHPRTEAPHGSDPFHNPDGTVDREALKMTGHPNAIPVTPLGQNPVLPNGGPRVAAPKGTPPATTNEPTVEQTPIIPTDDHPTQTEPVKPVNQRVGGTHQRGHRRPAADTPNGSSSASEALGGTPRRGLN